MATAPVTFSSTTEPQQQPSGPSRRPQSAERRLTRQFALLLGAGYALYLVTTAGYFGDAFRVSDLWWSIPATIGVFVSGLAIGAAALTRSHRAIRIAGTTALLVYLVASATWVIAWNGNLIDDSHGLWFVQFEGVPAIAAALVWRAPVVYAYFVAILISCSVSNFIVRTPGTNSSLWEELAFSGGYILVTTSAAIVGMRSGRLVDATRHRTYALAGAVAARRATEIERTRFNALTHDRVMATLLAAARHGNSDALSRQAASTLARLESLASDSTDDHQLDTREALARIRDATGEVDSLHVVVEEHTSAPDALYPSAVVRDVAAAAGEALRNSARHAGPGARVQVDVRLDDHRLSVTVIDDGIGFDTAAVPECRMGISISIRERMADVPGAGSAVTSAANKGTTVDLWWERP